MFFIAHRGNTLGPDPENENSISKIDSALDSGYDAEIDIRVLDGKIFLGHDGPQEEIGLAWIEERSKSLWVHCKNLEAMELFSELDHNHFWHQEDDYALTSKGFIWTYPNKRLSKKSIAVMPELWAGPKTECLGICSDFIARFREPSAK